MPSEQRDDSPEPLAIPDLLLPPVSRPNLSFSCLGPIEFRSCLLPVDTRDPIIPASCSKARPSAPTPVSSLPPQAPVLDSASFSAPESPTRTSTCVPPSQSIPFSIYSVDGLLCPTIPIADFKVSSLGTVFSIEICDEGPHAPSPNEPLSVFASKYKKVAKRTFPVSAITPEEFRIVRRRPDEPLGGMPPLPTAAPPFEPGSRYTNERKAEQIVDPQDFLLPDEVDLCHWILRTNEHGLAWDESEKGRFLAEYFDPVRIASIEHVPWVIRNIPIPPGIRDRVIQIIKDKIAAGTYEPSNSSYRSTWFCVLKKDGTSLRIVHDLQPMNKVTIRDASLPPNMDQMAEDFAGRGCYGMLDLFVAFDQRALDIGSRDMTTFQTPLGTYRLTSLPMGFTNSAQIMHGDVVHVLQDEIPEYAVPYIDDVPVKGPPTRYELSDGSHERLPDNPGIRRFVWEHLQVMHRILWRMGRYGGTFSGKKTFLCVPVIELVGHICSYEGRIPDQTRIKVITDWPACSTVSDVRSFLGTCGVMRVFIENFALKARPLVKLTHKDTPFAWEAIHQESMDSLKQAFVESRALRPIRYDVDWPVILSIDSSYIACGYILSQLHPDNKRYPARFGSIPWSKRESNYSQPKIELYGLFRTLHDIRIHIIGVRHLMVEMDASSIKQMLNNPDLQPNATINRWIAACKLFDFQLVHVPAASHKGPDGLSRRPPAPNESIDTADKADTWIDEACGFLYMLDDTRTSSRDLAPLRTPPTVVAFTTYALPDIRPDLVVSPRDEKAIAADTRVAMVENYLRHPLDTVPVEKKLQPGFFRYTTEFFLWDDRLWRRGAQGEHQLVITDPLRRASLLQQAHDSMGHKGRFTTRKQLLLRFWWPHLDTDVAWFDETCLDCQRRRTHHVMMPPTVAYPAPLFRKVYVDTMLMPLANKLKFIVHGRCSLTGWPEWRAISSDNKDQIGRFLFEEIICRWGGLDEIVTDNAPQWIAAAEWLRTNYGVHHIRISPYNSRANLVERRHYDVREAIVKSCAGDIKHWYKYVHHVFWAERCTIQRATGASPFYMAHGVEPVLPFDIDEATWLVKITDEFPMDTTDLIAARAVALQKRPEDLEQLRERIFQSRVKSTMRAANVNANKIIDYDFRPRDLVLVRDVDNEKNLSGKANPRYNGPYVVVRRNRGGAYVLAELDGSLSRLRYGAFRLVPYQARKAIDVDISHLLQLPPEELQALTQDDSIEVLADAGGEDDNSD